MKNRYQIAAQIVSDFPSIYFLLLKINNKDLKNKRFKINIEDLIRC